MSNILVMLAAGTTSVSLPSFVKDAGGCFTLDAFFLQLEELLKEKKALSIFFSVYSLKSQKSASFTAGVGAGDQITIRHFLSGKGHLVSLSSPSESSLVEIKDFILHRRFYS